MACVERDHVRFDPGEMTATAHRRVQCNAMSVLTGHTSVMLIIPKDKDRGMLDCLVNGHIVHLFLPESSDYRTTRLQHLVVKEARCGG